MKTQAKREQRRRVRDARERLSRKSERLVPTPDNFAPNYEDNHVSVRVKLLVWQISNREPILRVLTVVSGLDDCGFNREVQFSLDDEEAALRAYYRAVAEVGRWGAITMEQLYQLGFEPW